MTKVKDQTDRPTDNPNQGIQTADTKGEDQSDAAAEYAKLTLGDHPQGKQEA